MAAALHCSANTEFAQLQIWYEMCVCVFVCVHSGRRQGRCFEQRAAEHQATSGGDGGGEETAGGGDGPGNICL